MDLFSSILLGLALSFLGQLPLGTMSMTATQIAVQEDFRRAWKYSFGVTIVEIIYLRLVLSGVSWSVQHRLFFAVLNWITVVLFLVLGVISFLAARRQNAEKKALLLNNRLDRFLLGLSMSALNPAQIPFWFIWSSYFIDAGWLKQDSIHYNLFTAGSGVGTLLGLAVYMYGGNWLVVKMNAGNRVLNQIMGVVFILAALAQLIRIL